MWGACSATSGLTGITEQSEFLARAGVSEDLVRLSIGIEPVDDAIAEVGQALGAA